MSSKERPRTGSTPNAPKTLPARATVTHTNQDLVGLQEDEIDTEQKKPGMMSYPRSMKTKRLSKHLVNIVKDVADDGASDSGSDIILPVPIRTDYKTRQRRLSVPSTLSPHDLSSSHDEDSATLLSNPSLGSSISRFRSDFNELKCKMRIFGESLNLCRCLAHDFKSKLGHMERRLVTLERREKISHTESNYSAIIKKNKDLANKTKEIAKKLQMCGTEEEMRDIAAKICRDYLYGAWKTVQPADLQFRRISGGLSNYIYYVALPETTEAKQFKLYTSDPDKGLGSPSETFDEPRKVLLRIYGQIHGERAMDAIVTESVIFTLLSERRLGPKLYGVFSGGRIEEYIPARCLLTKELSEPAISMKIAEKAAAIHSMDIPLSKEPNWLWKTMGKWLKTCNEERLAVGAKGKNDVEEQIIKRLRTIDFDKEVEWLKKYLATVESPVVFCHNDLQEGNILILENDAQTTTDEFETSFVQTYEPEAVQAKDPRGLAHSQTPGEHSPAACHHNEKVYERSKSTFLDATFDDTNTSDTIITRLSDNDEPRLVLIDFEYCAYNHRGFDIANHMAEWGYDYTNPVYPFYLELADNWPTLEQKEIFIKEYLKHYTALSDGKEPAEPSIDAVNKLLAEVDAYTLASHLFWGLWSIVNASKSQIPFGYWEYSVCRIDTYLRLKQEIIKKDKYGLPLKRKIEEVDI